MIRSTSIYLILIVIGIVGCSQKQNDFAVIYGTVKNSKQNDSIVLQNHFAGVYRTIPINRDGTFRDTIKVDKIHLYRLFGGGISAALYLKNGYNLQITTTETNSNGVEQPVYSGKGSDVNTYYTDKEKLKLRMGRPSSSYTVSEEQFKSIVNDLVGGYMRLLSRAKIEDESFKEFEAKNNTWEQNNYYNTYSIVNKRKNTAYIPSPGFLPEVLANFKATDNDLYLNSFNYGKTARIIYNERFEQISNDPSKISAEEKIALLDNLLSTIEVAKFKTSQQKGWAYKLLGDSRGETAKKYINYFSSTVSDKDLVADLKEYYKNGEELIRGNDSPKFVDYKNYSGGKSSLDDFKGKYVFIDIWATWCGPCLRQIPYLKKIEEQFHDKNIVFIGISVDQPHHYNKWRDMVANKELSGIQLFAGNNSLITEFTKAYNVKEIPRFILIDPEGKIVDADAPHPSDPKLIKLFDRLNL